MKTTDARKLNQQTQLELRKQVVSLKQKSENNAKISEIVGLSQSHISLCGIVSVFNHRSNNIERS